MRFNFIGAIILLLGSTVVAQEPAYLNTKLSFEERAEDLISRMTLEEKVSQMLDQAPRSRGWEFMSITGGMRHFMG